MQLVRTQPQPAALQTTYQNAGANAAYQQAERELQASISELETTSENYNQLVDTYNEAKSNAERALLDPLIQEKADEYNEAVREYNRIGTQYQEAGVISGFQTLDEFTAVSRPTITGTLDGPVRGQSDIELPESQPIGMAGALGLVREAFIGEAVKSSNELFEDAASTVKKGVDFIQTPARATEEEQLALKQQRQDLLGIVLPGELADKLTGKTEGQKADEQYLYQDRLGKTQMVTGEALSNVFPTVGQLLKDSGSEILVSRDFNRFGFVDFETGRINRPSVYEMAAFGSALGASGAVIGSGAATGISGFGSLFPKMTAPALEAAASGAAGVTGGASGAGGALANVGAVESAAKTSLLGAAALGYNLQEIDAGIEDIVSQYPTRNQDDVRAPAVSGEIDTGIGDIISQYPTRSRYGSGNRYGRQESNQNQDWNRSEIDYRGGAGIGYRQDVVSDLWNDNALRSENQYQNRNDYLYEYSVLFETAPRSRRRRSFEDEEEDVIAEPRRKSRKKKSKFTEVLRL